MKSILITGGAGFIGSNAAAHYLKEGKKVIVYDNLSRAGSEVNLKWIKSLKGNLKFIKGDVRSDLNKLYKAVNEVDSVLHLAAQVAVTTSVIDPRTDFEINALGTFNVLEAIRNSSKKPALIYSSTNKVYGGMENVKVVKKNNRYVYKDYKQGISESFPLDFHSPYGCSKGSADQYVSDYSRIYGLKTVVARQSCIYGERQMGVEDQGWVSWFIIALVTGNPITIYGDGMQVRDILNVKDLILFYDLAFENIDMVKGEIFNVGGGPKFTMSVWGDFSKIIEKLVGRKIKVKYSGWRPGDQKIFVSDIRKAKRLLGWKPEIPVREGLEKLYNWVSENKNMFLTNYDAKNI